MSEWWTYRPSDFLMFSPRTYWRLVELYNREVWPVQLIALAGGLALLWLAAGARAPARRLVMASALAAAWLWVGWAFHWQRYATINWAAVWLAAAFWLQALLLLAFAALRPSGQRPRLTPGLQRTGWVMAIAGLLLYPLAGVVAGRPWSQAEVFGIMPEPTALATLGLLLAGRQPAVAWLSVIPVLSLLVGMATLALLSG